MSNGSDMGKRILSGGLAKSNAELDPESGLIAGKYSASIGGTYRAISKTF